MPDIERDDALVLDRFGSAHPAGRTRCQRCDHEWMDHHEHMCPDEYRILTTRTAMPDHEIMLMLSLMDKYVSTAQRDSVDRSNVRATSARLRRTYPLNPVAEPVRV
jgi:hypothetical protein